MPDTVTRSTPAPERVTFARLKSRAGWGLRGPAAALVKGATVAVTKRDGSTTSAVVGEVVWTDGVAALAAVAAEAPAAAPVARAANRPVAPAPAAAPRPEPVVVLDDAPARACCPACGYPQ